MLSFGGYPAYVFLCLPLKTKNLLLRVSNNSQCGIVDCVMNYDSGKQGSNPPSAWKVTQGVEVLKTLLKYLTYFGSPVRVPT